MEKILLLYIVLISLNISYQLNCVEFNSGTCGIFNEDYKDQCNVIGTCMEVEVEKGCIIENNGCKSENQNDKCTLIDYSISSYKTIKVCKKIIIDEGCEITSADKCQAKSTISQTAYCSYEDSYQTHCKKYNYDCSHFSNDDCGGLKGIKEENKQQCIKLSGSSTCSLLTIDEYCSIDETDKTCKKRGTFDENTYRCVKDNYNTKCIRKTICSTREIDKCTVNNDNCYKIYTESECQLVTVDEKCEIKNGYCSAKDDKYDKCSFNDDYTRCQYEAKKCDEILSTNDCSKYQSSNGKKCSKVENYQNCKEVTILSPCLINTNGKCVRDKEENDNKACSFDFYRDKCQLYEQDNECKIKQDEKCYDNPSATVTNKYCAFDDTNTKCKLRDVTKCENYVISNRCEADTKIKTTNKKCSWSTSSTSQTCKEYEIVSPCTVIDGKCKIDESKTLETDMECRFDNKLENKCMPKNKKQCKTYYNPNDCYNNNIQLADKKQCIYTGENNCKEITIDDNCEVGSTYHYCYNKPGVTFDQNKGICAFDDETNKNSCTRITRKCTQYTDNTCNALDKCSFYNNKCYETDDVCSFDDNGNTKIRPNKELKSTEKCDFVKENDVSIYKKVNKECNDYTDGDNDKCTNIPKTSENQCYKFSNENKCRLVTLDGNCKVIRDGNEDKCVADDSKSLSENEICAFTSNSKTECKKREKLCSDLKTTECNNFDLIVKQCYKLSATSNCKEIKVDSQCKIDEDMNCVNKGCSFNDDKDKCTYKNNGTLLKLKRFLLLLLFIIF